jgi:23S rRNA-/tRNA-specific pseudouridylate synthase
MLKRFSTKTSPLQLVNGIYNPPQSMSKRTADRWSAMVQQKSKKTTELKNINELITERCYTMTETDHNQTLVDIVSKKFGLDPWTARLKILNQEIWIKDSLHARYTDISPKAKISCGDVVCGAIKKKPVEVTAAPVKDQQDIRQRVIYKDERIIVINKWDLPVHGGSKNEQEHLEALLPLLVDKGDPVPLIVHRLDKATTGCLILARTTHVAMELAERFHSGESIIKRVSKSNVVYRSSCASVKGTNSRMGNNYPYDRIGSDWRS